jgi:DNA-binding transcriptional ArsR family regulator
MDIRKQGFIPLVLAEIVSEGAREFLRQQATGYSDAGGTLFIPQSGAYVLIDRAPPKREKRIMKSVLSGKTSLAVHVLMASIEPMTGVEIAEATGLSLGAVSGALDKLERMGWISTTARGARKLRSISDRSGLLASWRTSRQSEGPIEKQTFFVPQAGSTEELAARVAAAAETAGFDFRFSGIFGSQLHAPYLSSVRQVTCRVRNEDIPAIVETLGARAVSDGWNLALIPSDLPDSDAFRGTIGGFRVASPLVCWIDTVAEGGRAPELAAHLAQERLLSPPR